LELPTVAHPRILGCCFVAPSTWIPRICRDSAAAAVNMRLFVR
jgi:hypothetical protein